MIDYYAAIAPVLLAHLKGRPLTVKRWPDGVEGKSFFQKQAPAHRPEWVQTVTLPSERKPIDYLLADDLATLVWLANLAALELHTPLARAEAIERPTALVFDLDPGAPATIVECCRVGLRLHGMFENLGLQSFAKTSGSKGLQVYVPLNSPEVTYEQTKPFAKAVAELLEQRRTRPGRLAHDEGAAHGQGPDRLEPERPAQDDRVRLLAAGRRAPDRLDAGRLGRGACRAEFRRSGFTVIRGERGARARGRARRSVRTGPVARAGASSVRRDDPRLDHRGVPSPRQENLHQTAVVPPLAADVRAAAQHAAAGEADPTF